MRKGPGKDDEAGADTIARNRGIDETESLFEADSVWVWHLMREQTERGRRPSHENI